MASAAQRVVAVLSDELLLRAAKRNAAVLHQPTVVSDTDVLQVLHGLKAVVAEAAEERAPTSQALFFETILPIALSQGQGLATIIGNSVTFGILLAEEIASQLPADERKTATDWFAKFYGSYASQMVRQVSAL